MVQNNIEQYTVGEYRVTEENYGTAVQFNVYEKDRYTVVATIKPLKGANIEHLRDQLRAGTLIIPEYNVDWIRNGYYL